jgi:photosystem II stability/assembly factor-like uncharacterized protein
MIPNDLTTGLSANDAPIVLGMDFLNADDGWLMTSPGAGAGQEPLAVYRTTDGGATWARIAVTSMQNPSPDGLPDRGNKTGFAFESAEDGWLTGSTGMTAGSWLYSTSDGGKTWTTRTLSPPSGYSFIGAFPITFPPVFRDITGVMPIVWTTSTSRTLTSFYVTTDAGLHWRPTPPLNGREGVRAWSWPDASHGFAVLGSDFCSFNAASTAWHCQLTPQITSATELQFINDHIGFALTNFGLLATINAGKTWTAV